MNTKEMVALRDALMHFDNDVNFENFEVQGADKVEVTIRVADVGYFTVSRATLDEEA